ncbi:hypothetical protein V6N13_057063 [Hibiscus sabdariffa]
MVKISAFATSRRSNAYCGIKGTGLSTALEDRLWSLIHKYRRRHHFSPNAICPICHSADEDINHIFRLCAPALSTWSLLIQPSRLAAFFNMPLRQWIEVNLSPNSAFGHENEYWDIMFSAVLWNLWIQRNNAIFGNQSEEWASLITHCAEAIKLIHQDDRLGGPLTIVHHIREFLKKNWCISYVCINRVNNRVADALATTVNTSDFSLVEFDDPPNFVLPLLQEDMSSFSAPT